MNGRISVGAALCSISLLAPLSAAAQNGTELYYYPPSILSFGKSTMPIAGPGKVIVKVFVKADGTFTVQNVLRSTNPGDNATALDIAKRSKYKPGARGANKKPVAAFYDFTIDFKGSGSSASANSSDAPATASGLDAYEQEMRAGKFADAETGLTTYLAAHPGDQPATLDLATSQVFLSDYPSAAASFDKVTTLPDNKKSLAAKAYLEASTSAFKAKQTDVAVTYAKKALALSPGPYAYNALGMAEDASGDHDAGAADLQKARDTATSLKTSERVGIDVNLVGVLFAAGKDDQTKPVLAEINSLDPTSTGARNVVASHYIKLAQADDTASKLDDGESDWVQAAQAAPQQAGTLYGHAAIDELNKKSGSDLTKAKSLADKGIAAEPNSALSNYVAGYVSVKQGKKTDALAYLNTADASAKAGGNTSLATDVESLIKQANGL